MNSEDQLGMIECSVEESVPVSQIPVAGFLRFCSLGYLDLDLHYGDVFEVDPWASVKNMCMIGHHEDIERSHPMRWSIAVFENLVGVNIVLSSPEGGRRPYGSRHKRYVSWSPVLLLLSPRFLPSGSAALAGINILF